MLSLIVGFFTGVLALCAVLRLLAMTVAVHGSAARWTAGALGAVLLGGDAWAMSHRRLYPVGVRRQAQQRLMFTGHGRHVVAFVWGFDAGMGVTTYRVTSGLWFLSLLTVLAIVPGWILLMYGAGFVASLLDAVLTPVRASPGQPPGEAAFQRLMRRAENRRAVQMVYALLLLIATASILFA